MFGYTINFQKSCKICNNTEIILKFSQIFFNLSQNQIHIIDYMI